jgi:hypothetical protein
MAQRKLTEQEMNYRFAQASLFLRNITKIIGYLIRYGCISACAYYLFDALKTFSGKETSANFLFNFLINIKFDKWIGYLFGLGGMIYGSVRNMQLKKTRQAHSDHIRELETKLDPDRQKSRLNQYGETHDDDK